MVEAGEHGLFEKGKEEEEREKYKKTKEKEKKTGNIPEKTTRPEWEGRQGTARDAVRDDDGGGQAKRPNAGRTDT